MRTWMRTGLLVAGLGLATLLAGCPGMPGAGGGGAASQTPPGVLPPPGLTSGGVRSLVGATVTPPDNNILLARWTPEAIAAGEAQWIAVRRVTITENTVLLEGVNFDGRVQGMEKDQNRLLPLSRVTGLDWKYEPSPNAPSTKAPAGQPGEKQPAGRGGGAPAPAGGARRGR